MLDESPIIVNLSGQCSLEQAEIIRILVSTDNWIIQTHPLGPEKTITTPPIPSGAKRILYTKGNTSRGKEWWRTGADKLASYGLDTQVWTRQRNTISRAEMLDLPLQELPQTESKKDLPDMHLDVTVVVLGLH